MGHGLSSDTSPTATRVRTKRGDVWQHNKTILTSTPDPMTKMYKPGGTLTIMTQQHVHRVKTTGSDELGRWSWIEMRGKKHDIIIINAYMPCQRSTSNVGMLTYYMQLWRTVRRTTDANYEPRGSACDDLQLFIKNTMEHIT